MNHSKSTRFLAMLLAVVMVIGYVPVSAFAAENTEENADPVTATVTFDVNGGVGEYEPQVVTVGETVAKPEQDPTRDGYQFACWTADVETAAEWNFEEDTVAGDMTLYAAWGVSEAETDETTQGEAEPTEGKTEGGADEGNTTEGTTEGDTTEDTTEGETESDTAEGAAEGETEGTTGDDQDAVAAVSDEEEEKTGVYYDGKKFGMNGYYNVISRKDYRLVPGAAYEYEMVLNNDDGTRRQVIHVIEVDPSNPDVSIVPGYYQIDKDLTNETNWSHKELTEMAKYYEENLGYNIVGGMNTDLYYSTYSPRVLVYNGQSIGGFGKVQYVDDKGVTQTLGATSSILYVFKDAEGNISCDVKAFNQADFDAYLASGTLLHAVGVSFGMVVKDGQLVKTEERTSAAAARSMVGVKADGTLVICMNDGRGANNSVGFCDFEEGEAMLALGCQWAANCDGGGSSTFLTKRVGEETFTMRSVPCDGSQRPTAHGIFVASNVGPTGELNNVSIEDDYEIFAPKTEYTFGAEAIDTHGYAMEMPADASWALSDDSFGTIADGKFVSNGTKGTVDVQVISGEKIVGTKTITVADPEVFKLSADSTTVPYSTADKPRTITLPIVAMIGEANVYVDTNAVSVSLSDEKAGTLEGFSFTATTDTSVAGAKITVVYGETTLTYAISFGKGSEVIYDFEDGSKAGFMGFEEAKAWSQENGVNNTLVGSSPLAGQFNEYLSSETFIASTTNGGQVRNGSYALAWRLDNTDAAFASWSYNVLFNTGDTIVLRDVENDMLATTLGMWVYIPEEAFQTGTAGVAFQSQLYAKNADGTYSCKQDHFMFTSAATGKQTNLNSATNADIPESRWVYATIDISKYDYLCTPVATDEGNTRSPSFIRTYVKPTFPANITFYIDDITLDYSSAVDDRELPKISNPTYSTADTAVSLENGTTINGTKVGFAATVTDNAGLNYSSGKIYVDGVAFSAGIAGSVLSSKEDIVLVPGEHTVAFEVKDALGNPASITRTFTVSGEAAIAVEGHNDSGEAAKAQSVYYVDIKAADLSNVDKLVATLKLNTANTWETKGAVVADGFEASFQYNEISELLTVTIENVSGAAASAGTLVSIPVRVWVYDRYNYVTEQYETVASMGNKPVVDVECDVVYGKVTLADGSTSPIGGSIDVATELTTISSPYHVHDAELTVLNQEAACSVNGYENRTCCETCQSVVDWGTIIAAAGHSYVVSDDTLVCEKDNVTLNTTGLAVVGDKVYCLINGKLVTGWQNVDGEYVYANPKTKEVQVGTVTVSGITYNTDEMGIVEGVWVKDENGTKYSYGPKFHTREWVEIDDNTYYFGTDSYIYTGKRSIPVNRNNPNEGTKWYEFQDDGVFVKELSDYTGFLWENGYKYYVIDGMTSYGNLGLIEVDGSYYYLHFDGAVARNCSINVTNTHGLLPAGTYTFDEEGKLTGIKNGVCVDEADGLLYYYENGWKTYGGLMYLDSDADGEEDAYYYATSSGLVVCDKAYWITKTNDLLPAKKYTFGTDGKMIDPPTVDPDVPEIPGEQKNGIVKESDGKLYYYESGELAYGGLMLIDGDYYYATSAGEIICSRTYWISKTNNLLPEKKYTFGEDGKMIDPPTVDPDIPVIPEDQKDGIVRETDGKLYYYEGGKLAYGGLMLIDGDYYYATSAGEIICSKTYWITKTNDLLPAKKYTFGEDGKMIDPPTVDTDDPALEIPENGLYTDADGNMYYYENGQLAYGGLMLIDGDYYYATSAGEIIRNRNYWITKTNDLLPATKYTFGDDGKMVNPPA